MPGSAGSVLDLMVAETMGGSLLGAWRVGDWGVMGPAVDRSRGPWLGAETNSIVTPRLLVAQPRCVGGWVDGWTMMMDDGCGCGVVRWMEDE